MLTVSLSVSCARSDFCLALTRRPRAHLVVYGCCPRLRGCTWWGAPPELGLSKPQTSQPSQTLNHVLRFPPIRSKPRTIFMFHLCSKNVIKKGTPCVKLNIFLHAHVAQEGISETNRKGRKYFTPGANLQALWSCPASIGSTALRRCRWTACSHRPTSPVPRCHHAFWKWQRARCTQAWLASTLV